jgi:hypothetical protein
VSPLDGVPVVGMFAQVDGERTFLDRHLVVDGADTKPVDEMIAYLSVDGFWCVSLPHLAATDCAVCLHQLATFHIRPAHVRR